MIVLKFLIQKLFFWEKRIEGVVLNIFFILVGKEIKTTISGGSEALAAIFFYLLAILIFPLGFGTDSLLLGKIAAGAIWMAALFSSMLYLDNIFRSDFENGTLEQLVLSGISLELIVIAKCFSHWLTNGLPIVLLSPVLSIIIGLDWQYNWILILTLLIGTPSLTLIGAVPAALSCTIRKGGVVISLAILPLVLPILILGSGAITAEINGDGGISYLYLLGAILPISIIIVPFLGAKALRLGWE